MRISRIYIHQNYGSIALYAHKNIVDVMGDPAGKSSDSLHFLSLIELRFKLLFFIFRPDALRYVPYKSPESCFITVLVYYKKSRKLKKLCAPVFCNDFVVVYLRRFAGMINPVKYIVHSFRGFRSCVIAVIHAYQILNGISEQLDCGIINKSYITLRVDFIENLFYVLKYRPVFGFAFTKGDCSFFPVCYIKYLRYSPFLTGKRQYYC